MHSCPECGQACYCGGDIEDCPVSPDDEGNCIHCDGDSDLDVSFEDDEHDSGSILCCMSNEVLVEPATAKQDSSHRGGYAAEEQE